MEGEVLALDTAKAVKVCKEFYVFHQPRVHCETYLCT